ncbi:hypothetical protein ACJZ2D_013216 [Fusarium nematophilum]
MDALKFLDGATFQPSERAMLKMLKGGGWSIQPPWKREVQRLPMISSTSTWITPMMTSALWGVWLELVSYIPHGHEWHQCLALAVDFVRQDERAAGKGLTVATEWILNCSNTLEKETKGPNEELTEDEAGIRGTGKLCDDSITPRSLQRWGVLEETASRNCEGG